jgi:hypothetical protein
MLVLSPIVILVNRTLLSPPSGFNLILISSQTGYYNGGSSSARFHAPMGLAWSKTNNILYVADSQNHVIRQIKNGNDYIIISGVVLFTRNV